MSKTLFFFLLSELNTVRLVCQASNCQAVMEIPLEKLLRVSVARCPACNADWNPTHQDNTPLSDLGRVIAQLKLLAKVVEVEFPLPVKE